VGRAEFRIAIVFLCATVGAVAAPFVFSPINRWVSPLWALPGIPVVIVLATFGTIWYSRRSKARMKRSVQAAAGRVCVRCVYNLEGLGEAGECPECGRRFDIVVDRRSWERAGMLS
jgi:protein-S-isoprenylcysteine O-methyltransferase Ste14